MLFPKTCAKPSCVGSGFINIHLTFSDGGWRAGKIHTLNVVLLWQSEAECVCEGAHVCILSEVGSSLVEATFRPSVQEMKEG